MLKTLLEMGNLGQKTKAGFYKKVGRDVLRFDLARKEYVPGGEKADEVYARMLKKPAARAPEAAAQSEGAQGQFLWAILRNSFHYAAVHLATIAETARDVDFAMRWGFGMKQGPFELWQEAGWLQVANWIKEDIEAGKALSNAPLPDWVFKGPVAEAGGVHTPARVVEPDDEGNSSRAACCRCIRASISPRPCWAAMRRSFETAGKTLHEDDAIRLWTLDDEVIIASIKTKMHAIGMEVGEGLQMAVDLAEKDYQGVVIWSGDEPVQRRRRPAGHADRLCGRRHRRDRRRRAVHAADHAAAALCQRAGGLGDPRHGAGRRLRGGGAFRQARRRAWKATSAWSRWAWAWCPAPAA